MLLEVLPAYDSVKYFRIKCYGSLREMPQHPVPDDIRAWSLAEREPLDDPLDLRGSG